MDYLIQCCLPYYMCTYSGIITIDGSMAFTVDSDLNEASPQFTFTCISTGGPATTVTWTRNSGSASGDQMFLFNGDTTAPQYTHTLTVTGRLGGLYTCTVTNEKPSVDSEQLTVEGIIMLIIMWMCLESFLIFPPVASAPTNLMAVQEGPTSIRVSWSPPTPLGDTTGYRIYYSSGSSGSKGVSGGSTDNDLLTGLENGDIYTISIVATSQHLPSEQTTAVMVTLGEVMYNRVCSECD